MTDQTEKVMRFGQPYVRCLICNHFSLIKNLSDCGWCIRCQTEFKRLIRFLTAVAHAEWFYLRQLKLPL